MQVNSMTAGRLAVWLAIYFAGVIGLFIFIVTSTPWVTFVPIGGNDLDLPGSTRDIIDTLQGAEASGISALAPSLEIALVLITSLAGTIMLMIPITWIYMANKHAGGYRKNFVVALIVLPICATTIVMLIQDSLALAFGLAALVAAVRFRVDLDDALDGIYVFAAICVGLASGVGYLGVAVVMAVFFCFASVLLWGINYGANPVEEARRARKLAKQEQLPTDTGSAR